jgi:hypothetical protein
MPPPLLGFAKTPWLAAYLGVLHALLAGAAVTIELLDAWNDMNATMLVAIALQIVDYPMWMLADALVPPNVSRTAVVVSVAIFGTIVWMFVGLIVQSTWRAIRP